MQRHYQIDNTYVSLRAALTNAWEDVGVANAALKGHRDATPNVSQRDQDWHDMNHALNDHYNRVRQDAECIERTAELVWTDDPDIRSRLRNDASIQLADRQT